MAKIDNSSQGMKMLRQNLGGVLEDLKKDMKTSAQLVVDIKPHWHDHQYDTFLKNFNNGLTVVSALLKKMDLYDKLLEGLQSALKKYEDSIQVNPFK